MSYLFCSVCQTTYTDKAPDQCCGHALEIHDWPPLPLPTNRTFETGAQRHAANGKGRCDLLPVSALLAVSKHYEKGAERFGANNWMKGMPQNVLVDSGLRHLLQYNRGDTDEDHLVAAAWNILGALDQRERFAAGTLDTKLNNVPIKPE